MTTSDPPPPTHPATPKDYRKQLKDRQAYTQFYDPCAEANKAAMNCMDRNGYNREECLDFFQVYRDCKKTWMNQRSEDRRKGKNVT